MNPELLNEIQAIEAKHGSLANPEANLEKVHRIVSKLGMTKNNRHAPRFFSRKAIN